MARSRDGGNGSSGSATSPHRGEVASYGSSADGSVSNGRESADSVYSEDGVNRTDLSKETAAETARGTVRAPDRGS